MELKEDDVVLCRVKKIEGTTVFLEIENGLEGSMVLSEVAAGRIRNLRYYVVPNKVVVCKVLKFSNGHAELSLRRVTTKEKEQVLDRYRKEKAFENMLKIFCEDYEKIIKKIKEEYEILDFLDEARKNQKILEKFMSKDKAEKLSKRLTEKVEKEKIVSKKIILKSEAEEGIKNIKDTLDIKNSRIAYLGSSIFSISAYGKDFREADSNLTDALNEIEKRAKIKKVFFEILREK